MSEKWKNAGRRMLLCDLLNSAVAITLIARQPAKNAVSDHSLCWVPLKRKAGKCHSPHMDPRISPSEESSQACEPAVADNQSEGCDSRRVYGQEEKRVIAAELSEHRPHSFRKKEVEPKAPPRPIQTRSAETG